MFQIQCYSNGWAIAKVAFSSIGRHVIFNELSAQAMEFSTLEEAQKKLSEFLPTTNVFRILDLETLKVHTVIEKPRFRAANIPVRSTDGVLTEEHRKRGRWHPITPKMVVS